MIILGIDPGTTMIGYGIIKKKSEKIIPIDYGCIKTESKLPQSKRLKIIYQEVKKIIKKYKPDRISIEKIFFSKNLKTAISVSQARGVILLAAAELKVKIYEFTPLQVKQAVSNYGKAQKKQVQRMVKLLLNLDKIPEPDDAADALAIAICATNKFID